MIFMMQVFFLSKQLHDLEKSETQGSERNSIACDLMKTTLQQSLTEAQE